jgi:hypothetical protein
MAKDKYTGTSLVPKDGTTEDTNKAALDLLKKINEGAGDVDALSSQVTGIDTTVQGISASLAEPLVYTRYTGVAAIAPNTPFNFATKDKDSYNTVTVGAAWKFTAPKTGVYAVIGMVWPAGAVDLYMYKGGVSARYIRYLTATRAQFSDMVYLVKNEYIDYRCAATLTADALSYVNIAYLGNI